MILDATDFSPEDTLLLRGNRRSYTDDDGIAIFDSVTIVDSRDISCV